MRRSMRFLSIAAASPTPIDRSVQSEPLKAPGNCWPIRADVGVTHLLPVVAFATAIFLLASHWHGEVWARQICSQEPGEPRACTIDIPDEPSSSGRDDSYSEPERPERNQGGAGTESADDRRLTAAYEENERGFEAWKRRAFSEALTYFQNAAAQAPENTDYITNVSKARAEISAQNGDEALKRGEYGTALAAYESARAFFPGNWIENQIAAVKRMIAVDEEFKAHDRAVLAADQARIEAQQRTQNAAAALQNGVAGFADTLKSKPDSSALDFDSGWSAAAPVQTAEKTNPPPAKATTPITDSNVVDARDVPSGLPKGVESAISETYKDAPPGVSERVRKGFQAVMARDWSVARAYFQDALNHDAGDPGLKNLVAFASLGERQPAGHVTTTEGSHMAPKGPVPTAGENLDAFMELQAAEQIKKFNAEDAAARSGAAATADQTPANETASDWTAFFHSMMAPRPVARPKAIGAVRD